MAVRLRLVFFSFPYLQHVFQLNILKLYLLASYLHAIIPP